jgi:hypothetical protein
LRLDRKSENTERSDRASTTTGPRCCWWPDCGLQQSYRPRTSGCWFDRHPRWSDHLTLRGFFKMYFVDLRHAPHCAHAFGCAPHGTHNSTHATCGLSVRASPHISDISAVWRYWYIYIGVPLHNPSQGGYAGMGGLTTWGCG